MTTQDEIEGLAVRVSVADAIVLLDLADSPAPWLMGNPATFKDHASRVLFHEMGLLDAAFPEAKSGDAGRQFWQFNSLGRRLAAHLRARASRSASSGTEIGGVE